MIINKITVGWVTQTYDASIKRFIKQDFFAGDQVDFENNDGNTIDISKVNIDAKEIYCSYDMIQPETKHIRLHDLDDNSIGIVRTNISEAEFEALLISYSHIENHQHDIDSLIDYCKQKYPDYLCERFFIAREMETNI
jgi:hypothetical protein